MSKRERRTIDPDYIDARQHSRLVDIPPVDSHAALLRRVCHLELAVGRLAEEVDAQRPATTTISDWRALQSRAWPLLDRASALLHQSPPDSYRCAIEACDEIATNPQTSHAGELSARAEALLMAIVAGPRDDNEGGGRG